jgi:hypothetical protein
MIRLLLRDESGTVMVLAVITIVVMTMITAGLVTATTHETLSTQTALDGIRALALAEAGAARAVSSLRRDENWSVTGTALGRCGTYLGQAVLYDLLSGQCMGPGTYAEGMPFPVTGPIAVTTPGGSSTPAACASASVNNPGAGSVGAAGASAGRIFVTYQMVGASEIQVRVAAMASRASRGVQFTARRVSAADFAAYSSTSVDALSSGNGTFTINGSVYVRGDWSFKGQSRQLNNRPIRSTDTAPYDNQSYVCGNLHLQGNPQIGTPSERMFAIHIAGAITGSGTTSCSSSAGLCTQLLDNVVPDIQMGDVGARVAQIKSSTLYTNDLAGGGSLPNLAILELDGATWTPRAGRTDLVFGETSWRLPKRGRATECAAASPDNSNLATVLSECSALYVGSTHVLYVAGGQTIYVPGKVEVDQDVSYRIDTNPSAARVANDASTLVIACEAGNGCSPTNSSPSLAFEVDKMIRAQLPASGAGTSFPSQDLLGVIVNGKTEFDLNGNASSQEVNLMLVGGCSVSLPASRCTTSIEKNLYFYGSLIARSLVFKQNVDVFQVPDLTTYVPASILDLLVDPVGTAVVMRQWREIGF